jgi:pSer/pThr/pTyr-binding forkhead associated (FHA) protein
MFALVLRATPQGDEMVPLSPDKALTIGRAQSCDITIHDDGASRQHARVCLVDGKVEVEDLSSRNGTWLAGKRISKKEWLPGKTLRVGDTEIDLRVEAGAANQDTVVLAKDGIPATKPVAGNFVTRHWRGGYSLGRSIFVNTLLLSLAYTLIVANLTESVAADASPRSRIAFVTVTFLIGLALLVWQIVGDWRSLRGAKARGAGRFSRGLAGVFTVLLALGVPGSITEYVGAVAALRDIETGRSLGGESYTLTTSGNVLTFDGVVVWPLVEDMRRELEANPEIDIVVLNSPGGDTTAGRRVNDLLRAREITTAVVQSCASACTLIYAGGTRRLIGPDGQLGFHATSVILMDPMMSRIMNSFTFRHDSLNAKYYRLAGIAEEFIERAVATPSTDLWVPPHDVLVDAGVVHRILEQ